MYRIGTGDCFVLQFHRADQTVCSMLIDFGSCMGTKADFDRFATEIRDHVNGRIDVLVVTHEHLDHIIGFERGSDVFQTIEIGQVWVAWTEDPTDKLAKRLKSSYGKDRQALAAAVAKMEMMVNDPNYRAMVAAEWDASARLKRQEAFVAGLQDLLFHYTGTANAAAAMTSQTQRAMEYVLHKISKQTKEPPFYCVPGRQEPKVKGLDGVRFYVLGPPRDESYLKQEESSDEVYTRKRGFADDPAFSDALHDDAAKLEKIRPFEKSFSFEEKEAVKIRSEQLAGRNAWRNISLDWLTSAGHLALRLDRYMNNMSLALAIELEDSGKVLLFPGDAQSGNWRSWHDDDLRWTVGSGKDSQTICARDLLERTVFYKVGHHLSHNGTASRSGLELMNSDDLVAFAPLDENKISAGWGRTMPSPGVLEELIRRTKGRIFRIDTKLESDPRAKAERRKFSRSDDELFKGAYEITDSYIEYTITL
jgi:hypothetical protein